MAAEGLLQSQASNFREVLRSTTSVTQSETASMVTASENIHAESTRLFPLFSAARCPKTDALVFSFWREVENSTSQFAAIRSEVSSTNEGIALAVVTGSPFRDVARHIADSL